MDVPADVMVMESKHPKKQIHHLESVTKLNQVFMSGKRKINFIITMIVVKIKMPQDAESVKMFFIRTARFFVN